MLKKIPNLLSPDLLKILHEMGHGDEIVIGDGNFPAANYTNNLIRCDGHNIPDLLEAILELFPIDTYVDKPISLMKVADPEKESNPVIWEVYKDILNACNLSNNKIEYVEKLDFYEKTKKAYAVIATTEQALYANILLKKGIIS